MTAFANCSNALEIVVTLVNLDLFSYQNKLEFRLAKQVYSWKDLQVKIT